MKQDRFLIGILIGIGVLIVLALVVGLNAPQKVDYISEDTPDGIVHNFVLALLEKEYEKAYGYLADLEHKPEFADFRRPFAVGELSPRDVGIKVGAAEIIGDVASVEVTTVFSTGDPFSSGNADVGTAELVLQAGSWKISSMPVFQLWHYSWYRKP